MPSRSRISDDRARSVTQCIALSSTHINRSTRCSVTLSTTHSPPHDIDISEDERDDVLSVYHNLDVFEDAHDGLKRLADGGYDCYILSNGNPEMLESLVEQADIGGFIEDTISADEVRIYKPVPEPYRQAAARTGTPIGEIAHVAAGWWDVHGARHATCLLLVATSARRDAS